MRGDWLWSGKGMIDAQMPRIIDGWISQCVYVLQYSVPKNKYCKVNSG